MARSTDLAKACGSGWARHCRNSAEIYRAHLNHREGQRHFVECSACSPPCEPQATTCEITTWRSSAEWKATSGYYRKPGLSTLTLQRMCTGAVQTSLL